MTVKIAIKSGIFQGDCLCALLFCLALIPLTNVLNKQGAGCDIKEINKVSHLFYMDDLKLFYRDGTEL